MNYDENIDYVSGNDEDLAKVMIKENIEILGDVRK